MKLSYKWLKEYVKVDVSADELANGLTMSGSEVESVDDLDGDKVMSLEITSNRPDCLNIIGLAREASAVFDRDLVIPSARVTEEAAGKGPEIECRIENRQLCPRYTARVITGVKVGKASDKIRKRILAIGLRDVNNVVDVTNYCLMEMGQPLHAFDLDKIKGGKVIIREAGKGEKIVTIDGEERELSPGMLVIADASGPIAIAGVMGGRDTEVSETTKNVLLESAYFDPVSIRRTARSLGLSSDSSYRFERGVDKGAVLTASDRTAELISAETGGKICSLYDVGALAPEEVSIVFSVEKAEKILGAEMDKGKIKHVFARLGMAVSEGELPGLVVSIPSFREDLRKEVDLVEEIARIYGYDRIPATVPKFVAGVKRKERSRLVDEKLREMLPALGLSEIMTYSLISEKAVKRFEDISGAPVELINPLSEEQKIMATQLLDGMLHAISWNLNRKNEELAFFELGKIYSRPEKRTGGKGAFKEIPALCIGLTGLVRKNWEEGERPADLYDLKGILESLFRALKVPIYFYPTRIKGMESCAGIRFSAENTEAGFLGEIDQKLLGDYDIKQRVFVCQVKLDGIMEKSVLENRYHTIPKFPSSTRDVSILCDQTLPAGEVRKVISETGEEIIREIELVEVYEGEQIPAGEKSLTYSIRYGLDIRTLTDKEVEGVHSRVKKALREKLDVTFR
ncbi:MAG: phenylalanine--tRNA ligase subunit beta [Candidatus Omnitrophota bacterium]|nr:phenylalanine--tRNA ligase subunit beta [Candidatus Omnitrophota bacterium]